MNFNFKILERKPWIIILNAQQDDEEPDWEETEWYLMQKST